MGNNAIIIRTVGSHHNGNAGYDAEQIAKRCVDELRAAGHTILSASVESGGGSIVLAGPELYDGTSSLRGHVGRDGKLVRDDSVKGFELVDADAPARAAYERYLASSGGKSLVSGADLPGWDALSPGIKAAWMAAVDHTAPRLQR